MIFLGVSNKTNCNKLIRSPTLKQGVYVYVCVCVYHLSIIVLLMFSKTVQYKPREFQGGFTKTVKYTGAQ